MEVELVVVLSIGIEVSLLETVLMLLNDGKSELKEFDNEEIETGLLLSRVSLLASLEEGSTVVNAAEVNSTVFESTILDSIMLLDHTLEM